MSIHPSILSFPGSEMPAGPKQCLFEGLSIPHGEVFHPPSMLETFDKEMEGNGSTSGENITVNPFCTLCECKVSSLNVHACVVHSFTSCSGHLYAHIHVIVVLLMMCKFSFRMVRLSVLTSPPPAPLSPVTTVRPSSLMVAAAWCVQLVSIFRIALYDYIHSYGSPACIYNVHVVQS